MIKRIYWWFVVLLIGLPAQSAIVNVTGEYKPAIYEAGGGKFINTTPCLDFPNAIGFWCSTTATADTPQALSIRTKIDRVVRNNNNVMDAITYQAFMGARDISLVRTTGGKEHKLKFILIRIGAQVIPNINKEASSTGSYYLNDIEGDCIAQSTWAASSSSFDYFHAVKSPNQLNGGKCYNTKFNPTFSSKAVSLGRLYIGYKLNAPDPLKMENGIYKGSLTISLGPNGDLSFGNGVYADNEITFIITLTVQHQFKMDFEPGSDKVTLLPPGGWNNWVYLGKNRLPPMLSSSIKSVISSSSVIKMTLRCEYGNGDDECAIKNSGDGHLSALRVYLAKIGGARLTTNRPLYMGPGGSHGYINLHFVINDRHVLNEMMKHPGGKYNGKVTIIFDAVI